MFLQALIANLKVFFSQQISSLKVLFHLDKNKIESPL